MKPSCATQLALTHAVDACPFVYVGGLEKLRPNFELGKSQVNLKKIAPWGTHWASLSGRITLRLAAIKAAEAGHVEVLDCFCKEWKVPVNSIPADEKNVPPTITRADKEDVAMHLLSLAGSEEALDLERDLGIGNTLLHSAAWNGQTRLFSPRLYHGPFFLFFLRSYVLLFDRGKMGLGLLVETETCLGTVKHVSRQEDLLEHNESFLTPPSSYVGRLSICLHCPRFTSYFN
jgi:hypothetical protein